MQLFNSPNLFNHKFFQNIPDKVSFIVFLSNEDYYIRKKWQKNFQKICLAIKKGVWVNWASA